MRTKRSEGSRHLTSAGKSVNSDDTSVTRRLCCALPHVDLHWSQTRNHDVESHRRKNQIPTRNSHQHAKVGSRGAQMLRDCM